jgi:hypothetical protein
MSSFLYMASLLSFLPNVNMVMQFYSHKLEPGSIGALPEGHRDSTGITRSLTVVKSAVVGMDCDETVFSRVCLHPDQPGITRIAYRTYISSAISCTELGIHLDSCFWFDYLEKHNGTSRFRGLRHHSYTVAITGTVSMLTLSLKVSQNIHQWCHILP